MAALCSSFVFADIELEVVARGDEGLTATQANKPDAKLSDALRFAVMVGVLIVTMRRVAQSLLCCGGDEGSSCEVVLSRAKARVESAAAAELTRSDQG